MCEFGSKCRALADELIALARQAPDPHRQKLALAASLVGMTALDVAIEQNPPVTIDESAKDERDATGGGPVGLVDAIGW